MTARRKTRRRRPTNVKVRRSAFGDEMIAGLREAIAFERGQATSAVFKAAPLSARSVDAIPAPSFRPDEIVAIRHRLGLSQAVFARLLNVSPATARSWEQGVNTPGGPSSRLLQVAAANPEVLLPYVEWRRQ